MIAKRLCFFGFFFDLLAFDGATTAGDAFVIVMEARTVVVVGGGGVGELTVADAGKAHVRV